MTKRTHHEVTVKIWFDRPITKAQAQYAAWNHLNTEIYGGDDNREPWGEAKVRAPKSPRKASE